VIEACGSEAAGNLWTDPKYGSRHSSRGRNEFMFLATERTTMPIDTYLTIVLVAAITLAVGIALSIVGRMLVTIPTYLWRLQTGSLSASDRYWNIETGTHRRLSLMAMQQQTRRQLV
jgi:hypothetical protein